MNATTVKTTRPMPTEPDTIPDAFGNLTAQQRQAAVLLLSGSSVQDVARELAVHRSTIWEWRRLETFQAFYNVQLQEIQQQTVEGLLGLHSEAVATIRRILTSGNDATAMKAALHVLEGIQRMSPGETDPREIIRTKFTTREDLHDRLYRFEASHFDEVGYQKKCSDLGL